MGFYSMGLDDAQVGAGGFLTVYTPGFIRSTVAAADAHINGIDRNVQRERAKLSPTFLDGWHSFVEEWIAFRNGSGNRWSGVVYDTTLEYVRRADAWAEELRRQGVETAPSSTSPSHERERQKTETQEASIAKPFLWIAAIGVGAYGLGKLGSLVGSVRSKGK